MTNIIKLNFPRKWNHHLESLIGEHLNSGTFPGVEILFTVKDQLILHNAWGNIEISTHSSKLIPNTVFDVASLTKPIVTATCILILQENGLLDLEEKVVEFIPEFDSESKREVSIKNLLTHTSGLPAWANLYDGVKSREEAWKRLMDVNLESMRNQKMTYSCLGYLILGEIIQRVSDTPLSEFAQKNIFSPLNMESSCFFPHRSQSTASIAPTQFCAFRKKLLRGVVHDENCFIFNEEGGNAGLFSNMHDLQRFCQMIFNNGSLEGTRILSPYSIHCMTQNHNPPLLEPRGIGWDIKHQNQNYMSAGKLFPEPTFGHTGFTGTSLWFNIPHQIMIIILSNRVHISREKNIPDMKKFRVRLHNILIASLNE